VIMSALLAGTKPTTAKQAKNQLFIGSWLRQFQVQRHSPNRISMAHPQTSENLGANLMNFQI